MINKASEVLKATREALAGLPGSLSAVKRASSIISKRKGDIIVTGIGKSGFIGQKLVATLTSLGERAFYLHPTEALHGDFGMLSKGDVLIALSFSGESKEVVSIARYAKKNFNVPIIAICKNPGTSLGKISNCTIEVPAKAEGSPNGIAPMASTTTMLVISDMLAAEVVNPNFNNEHFATYHPGGALGLSLKKVKDFMIKGKALPKVKESSAFLNAVKEITNKKLGVTAVLGAKGQVTGAITDGDIRRFVLKNKKIETALAMDAMTPNPKRIHEDDSLQLALSTMENHKITSIFVADKAGRLTGIIHLHRILQEMSL